MDKKILVDIDGLLQVLQAIKDGKPVEYRPLEESAWIDFDPEVCEIDTENCKYRVKMDGYPEEDLNIRFELEDLQKERIYQVWHDDVFKDKIDFICVKSNMYGFNRFLNLHFSLSNFVDGIVLKVCDPETRNIHSVRTDSMANIISPNLGMDNFNNVSFRMPTLAQVKMLEAKLREVGYELKNGKMQRV